MLNSVPGTEHLINDTGHHHLIAQIEIIIVKDEETKVQRVSQLINIKA